MGEDDRSDPLAAALDAIVEDALLEWDRVQGEPPSLLYHYTDVVGLIGICTSASLRATNLRFMNDAQELSHGWKLMRQVLGEAEAKAKGPAQVELIEELGQIMSTPYGGYPDFYSVSFSADGDLLSQWRGYGSDGGGYAVGFDTADLASFSAQTSGPRRVLNRVIYDEELQLQILHRTAEAMLELFAQVEPGDPLLTTLRAQTFAALGQLVGFAFAFKDPAWAEEREWRVVRAVSDNELHGVRFRPGTGGVAVPFISIGPDGGSVGDLPIRQIVQGPTTSPDIAAESVKILLATNGYTDVEVKASSIPLRP